MEKSRERLIEEKVIARKVELLHAVEKEINAAVDEILEIGIGDSFDRIIGAAETVPLGNLHLSTASTTQSHLINKLKKRALKKLVDVNDFMDRADGV
ncbi:hypothetical protein NGG61_10230 [Enterococcus casseliflavus]|uniref:hypothetical protein n=1 Tax=Enterococcus casseliflavus TaxID=37734 RepID=UPI002DB5B394|nr:hypothetical protein [Enterococcus casseliflavus]MEB8400300.1 hypothetical protein [Enterococcus casseliflavus]